MIEPGKGNLLLAEVDALVNTVNIDGFMGKGIALQFKQAFPENFRFYEKACRAKQVEPGKMLTFETGQLTKPKFIINFPTKRHWRNKSRIDDIKRGLVALIADVRRLKIESIAVPPLGCGNGGLDWADVRPLIERAFSQVPETRVLLFSPQGAPDAKTMPVRTERPSMTPSRALMVLLIDRYGALEYRCTLLEVQKLAYFLQEAGEPLRLKYQAGHYGPYADNLNKVLERIEGHLLRGYGDSQNPEADLVVLDGAVDEAQKLVEQNGDSARRLERVAELIEGFETPYGLELLASVHWAAVHATPPARDPEAALAVLQRWSKRKERFFTRRHVQVAWDRLQSLAWIPESHQADRSHQGGPQSV